MSDKEMLDVTAEIVEITAYGKSFCSICLETQKVIILKSQEG